MSKSVYEFKITEARSITIPKGDGGGGRLFIQIDIRCQTAGTMCTLTSYQPVIPSVTFID